MQNTQPSVTSEGLIPGATGKFGFEETNPIPLSNIPDSYYYLQHLYTTSGRPVRAQRLGSLSAPNIKAIIDAYDLYSLTGEKLATIYICPYYHVTQPKTPEGFMLKF